VATSRNPYAPPAAPVLDPVEQWALGSEALIPNGRRLRAGRGARWIGDAWSLFRARPGKWLLCILILLVVELALGRVPLGGAVRSMFWPFASAGLVTAADLQRRTGTFAIVALFAGLRRPGPLLLVSLLSLVGLAIAYASYAVVLGPDIANRAVFQAGGASTAAQIPLAAYGRILLIMMPLSLPVSAEMYFAASLIMLHNISPGTAMKMSLMGWFKNVLPGLVFVISAAVFVFVSIIPLGLGLFISIPVLMITNYTIYRDVFCPNEDR
jgi:hypothetical protein